MHAKRDTALPPSPIAVTMLLELIGSHGLQIPQNAFMLDFVFSDVESGDGTYDNQGGKDYHLPVEGSKASTLSTSSALLPAKVSGAPASELSWTHPLLLVDASFCSFKACSSHLHAAASKCLDCVMLPPACSWPCSC